MLAKDFYAIISTEETCVSYLQSLGLLPHPRENVMYCKVCEANGLRSELKEVTRRKKRKDGTLRHYKSLRCTYSKCQTYQSIRSTNQFFTYTDLNGRCNSKLSLGEILELVYYWANDLPQETVVRLTGRSHEAICDWYNLCRDVCVTLFDQRQPMGGKNEVIQIDESLLRGKRKSNKGRLLLADVGPEGKQSRRRNFGKRIAGPWVFGLCWRHDGILEKRFFIVQKRDRKTLIPIIRQEVVKGSVIRSDEWRAYSRINKYGYTHQTVNHQEYFVDPSTGVHTQTIESIWGQLKFRILRKMHGTSMLQRHLAEAWWRSVSSKESYLQRILEDIKRVYLTE